MTPRDDATAAQMRAARPDASTWLTANAGSGKTRVLTDRVARLLLEGVEPQQILCLTYTKAAASEMQNRLFRRLGAWAMLENAALVAALRDLGIEGAIGAPRLKDARTLFARAIETPGGLKIQTIHSFCASLLRRFPLEAGVSPQFKEIEDRAADLLRAEIVDLMADGPDADVIADLAAHYTGEDFGKLTQAIVRHREGFARPLDWAAVLDVFGQAGDLTRQIIEQQVFLGNERQIIDQMIPPMLQKGGNDEKGAMKLGAIAALDFGALPALEDIFLTGKGAKVPFSAKIGALPTKPTQEILAQIKPEVDNFMQRLETARPGRLALMAAQKTHALHRFAARFLPLYEEAKTLRGWLDFDDLIDRARALLNDKHVAAWVLWRIDGGIDHVLVDEAQDTSPAQWDVIRKLTAEFTSGEGARNNRDRTIFTVGDKKQSIYSFQGADPREFDRMQSEFRDRFDAAQKSFQTQSLAFSFRSAPVVLDAVDRTFEGQESAGFGEDATHIAFKAALPGRVDLWPLIEPAPKEEDRDWDDPLDRVGTQHHTVILARQIAKKIAWMLETAQTIPFENKETGQIARRPVQPGDFLILVQRRSPLFSEIIRACKTAGLAIAGADRLKVGGELAVRDLAALLSFLAVPEDDLSLAAALKSPLFGWSEQKLFDLAHRRRQEYLWEALRKRAAEYPDEMAVLNDLRGKTDFLRPYDLIERILTRHKGRKNLLARLGAEAEDGINALLSQALAFEQNAVPSLTGFLFWMETDDLEIKRQIDSASNQIRVMTVHGAKGLEAPIVILPDCGKRDVQIKDEIVMIGDSPVWKTVADDMPPALQDSVEALKDSQIEERLRLLYVAMTRAEKWLIVAAAGELPKDGSSWYQIVGQGLDDLGASLVDFGGLAVRRRASGDWEGLPMAEGLRNAAAQPEIDPFFSEKAAPPVDRKTTLSPSDLGGAKALAGEAGRDEEAAKAYGTLVHRYLEHLSAVPVADWPGLVSVLVDADDPEAQAAMTEAQQVLGTPALRPLFDEGSLCEVSISANLGSERLHGVIDRLLVSDKRVLAVDFKTNQTVPGHPRDCPEGILRQMGAYAHALQQIYPDRTVETAIVWTDACILMPLPHDCVIAALQNTPCLDAAGGSP